MPDAKTIHTEILARLDELERLLAPLGREAEQLTRMVESIDAVETQSAAPATSPPRARKARGRATTAKATAVEPKRRRSGRPPGSGGRARQALAKISEQPGITAPELAKAMGINPNYLYRVLPRLEKEAKITKEGKGYRLSGDLDGAAPPTDGPPPEA